MHHYDPKTLIKYLVFMGDSLSDRGTFSKRPIFYGLLPNDLIVDLSKSPHGRFTNGYTWDDYLCTSFVSKYLSRDLEKKFKMDAADISDAVINKDPKVEPMVQNENTLSNDRKVDSEGERLARAYCEGGLTSHNYAHSVIINPSAEMARIIVSTLENKRALLLEDDTKLDVNAEEKHQTLIIEWSGANDLITVNTQPTKQEADSAIAARMENIKKLYEAGYRHFALFGLPDLACTPRFQAMKQSDRENASDVCNYFNEKLAKECINLLADYTDVTINYVDIMQPFKEIYENPEKYKFEKSKLKHAYNTSTDYKMNPDRTSPAPGYLFWDDIHPTAHAHVLLATIITEKLNETYRFRAPPQTAKTDPQSMYEQFIRDYNKKFKSDQEWGYGVYSIVATNRLPADVHVAFTKDTDFHEVLAKILHHGINEKGARTRSVLLDLKWINSKNEIDVTNPALEAAKKIMDLSADDVKLKK